MDINSINGWIAGAVAVMANARISNGVSSSWPDVGSWQLDPVVVVKVMRNACEGRVQDA